MCSIDLLSVSLTYARYSLELRTPSIAFLTLSELIKPLLAKFSIKASLEVPEDLHAMLMLLRAAVEAWLPILMGLL